MEFQKKTLVVVFPSEVWSITTSYLDGIAVSRLLCCGSKMVNVILLRNKGITQLNYPATHLKANRWAEPSMAVVTQFPQITSFSFDLNSSLSNRLFASFKITVFPPTLTKLSIKFPSGSPELIFHQATLDDVGNNVYKLSHFVNRQDDGWLPISKILPNLRHFTLIGHDYWSSRNSRALGDAVSALPLLSLNTSLFCPFFQVSSDLPRFSHLLAVASPNAWDDQWIHSNSFPHHITSLRLPSCDIHGSQIHVFTQLQELELCKLIGETCNTISLLPRSLRFLKVKYLNLMVEDIEKLPPTLVSIQIQSWPTIECIRTLPSSLTSFGASCLFSNDHSTLKPYEGLSKNLLELQLNYAMQTIGDVKHFTSFVPRLTSLDLVGSKFYDYWIPSLPKQLTSMKCMDWRVTGFLVKNDVFELDTRTLLSSIYNCQIAKPSYHQVSLEPLKYLTASIHKIAPHLQFDKRLRVRDLPKALTTLPSSVPIHDNEDVMEVSPNARRVWIAGPMRFRSWLKLPPSVCIAKGGSIIYEMDDVERALSILRAYDLELLGLQNLALSCSRPPTSSGEGLESSVESSSASGNRETQQGPIGKMLAKFLPISTASIHFPHSIERVVRPEAAQHGPVLDHIFYSSHQAPYAVYDQRHFQMFPASITELSLRAPPNDFQVPFTCRPDDIPLPSTITRLTVENGPLRKCHLLPHMLPSSLVSLSVFEEISDIEINQLSHLTKLQSLEVMNITGSISPNLYLTSLPPSLTHLRIIATSIPSENFKLFPPSLKSLDLDNKQDISPLHLLSLPPSLTSIRLSNKKGLCRKIREAVLWKISTSSQNKKLTLLPFEKDPLLAMRACISSTKEGSV